MRRRALISAFDLSKLRLKGVCMNSFASINVNGKRISCIVDPSDYSVDMELEPLADCTKMFYMTTFVTIDEVPDTSRVSSMKDMFRSNSNLTDINLPHINTKNVTDMSGMFCSNSQLHRIDLSQFNTSKVTNMQAMFYNSGGIYTLDLSNFDFSLINNGQARQMFASISSLQFLDLSNPTAINLAKSDLFDNQTGMQYGLTIRCYSDFKAAYLESGYTLPSKITWECMN